MTDRPFWICNSAIKNGCPAIFSVTLFNFVKNTQRMRSFVVILAIFLTAACSSSDSDQQETPELRVDLEASGSKTRVMVDAPTTPPPPNTAPPSGSGPSSADARPPDLSQYKQMESAPKPKPKPDCSFPVVKRQFTSDPRYDDIVEAIQDFEDYKASFGKELPRVTTAFFNIYKKIAHKVTHCSPEYMEHFAVDEEAEAYAEKMCRQMNLSAYFNQKYPCIKELDSLQLVKLMK